MTNKEQAIFDSTVVRLSADVLPRYPDSIGSVPMPTSFAQIAPIAHLRTDMMREVWMRAIAVNPAQTSEQVAALVPVIQDEHRMRYSRSASAYALDVRPPMPPAACLEGPARVPMPL